MKKILFCFLIAFSSVSFGKTFLNNKLYIEGYLGYRHIFNEVNGYPVDSSIELGGILNYEFNKNFNFFTELNFDDNTADGEDFFNQYVITNSFISYNIPVLNRFHFRTDVGRIRYTLAQYNRNRANPNTRPGGIIEDQGIYRSVNRLITTSGDGVRFELGDQNFTFATSIARPHIIDPEREAILWTGRPGGEIKAKFGGAQTFHLTIHPKASRFVWTGSYAIFNFDKDAQPEFILGGVKYLGNNWRFSGEGVFFKPNNFKWTDGLKKLGTGFVLGLDYDLNQYFTARISHSRLHATSDTDVLINRFGFPKAIESYRDTSIGLAFRKNNWLIQADVHYAKGATVIAPNKLDFTGSEPYDGYWFGGISVVKFFN